MNWKIDEKVKQAARHEEWRTEYMTLLQRDREKFAEGKAEGLAEGKAEGLAEGIQILIVTCRELGVDFDSTEDKVKQRFCLSDMEAAESMRLYW